MSVKDIKTIKTIVDWLNEEHQPKNQQKQFLAYFEKEDKLQMWHIACLDYWLYSSEEYSYTKEAVRETFPDTRMVFVALNFLGIWVMNKRKETQAGRPVIIVK